MIPVPVNFHGADLAVTGSFSGGEFRAVSVRSDGVEILPILNRVGVLSTLEAFAEWEILTRSSP